MSIILKIEIKRYYMGSLSQQHNHVNNLTNSTPISYAFIAMLMSANLSLANTNLDKENIKQDSKQQTMTSDDKKAYKLKSVVTTATGFSQDKKVAPASITVISKEEILERPIKDLGDAVQDVPGVYVEQTKTGQNQIYMRGLGSDYTLILIDGKRQNVNSAFNQNGFGGVLTSFMPPLSMIERIEVIRGPASIIYGTDAMGGVINIITKKNPQKLTGSVMIESTIQEQRKNWGDNYGVNTYVATPIVKDVLSLSLRGAYKYSQPSYFYNPIGTSSNGNPYTTHSPGGWYSYNAGARLDYIINKHNSIYLDGEFYHTTNTTLNTSSRNISATNDFDKTNIVLSHDSEYNWGKFANYIQYSLTQRIPQTTTGFGNVSGPLNYNSIFQNHDIVLSSMYNRDFNFDGWGDLGLTSGIYYLYERLILKSSNFDRDMHQLALFAEGQWFINEYFSTTLGLRYNYANLYAAMPNPRLYINYNPFSWLTFKVGVASGMKIPSLQESYNGLYQIDTSGIYYYGTKDLQAEKSWNYELSTIIDTEPAYITLTGFYTDFRDQIQTISSVPQHTILPGGFVCASSISCTYFNNVDQSLVAGVEFSLQTKPFYGVSFDASYAFTYTEQLTGSQKGQPVNSIPQHKLMTKITYKYQNFSTYLRMQGNFKTPTIATGRGGDPTILVGQYYKDYILLDMAFNYTFFKYYTLTLSLNNLLNTNFIDYAIGNNPRTYVNRYQRFLPGRNYWLSFKINF